ncbi:hypothetical protein BH23BAC1_BH23BAC1_51710 [soil metagenome]
MEISNRGGWQSKTDLFESDNKTISLFKEKILKAHKQLLKHLNQDNSDENLKDWLIEAWANINLKGHSNSSHDHTKNHNLWSGIYYLENGGNEKDIAGETVFEDRHYTSNGYTVNRVPSEIRNMAPVKNEYKIQPKTGMMVLFPGTLFHRVEKYNGQNERITIAFNLRHKNFGYYDFDSEIPGSSGKLKNWLWYNFRGAMRLANFILKKTIKK